MRPAGWPLRSYAGGRRSETFDIVAAPLPLERCETLGSDPEFVAQRESYAFLSEIESQDATGNSHISIVGGKGYPGPCENASEHLHSLYAANGRSCLASQIQSVDYCAYRNACHIYGSARHVHCERGAAAHRGRTLGHAGRIHVGVDQLSRLQRHHSSHQRVAFGAGRTEALLYDVRDAVHGELVPLRLCAVTRDACFLPCSCLLYT